MAEHIVAGSCWSCIVGLHDDCYDPIDLEDGELQCCCYTTHAQADAKAYAKNPVGRPVVNPEDSADFVSAGRKRAKLVAPIFAGMTCEWAGLKYAGGGPQPIIGCRGNLIVDVKGGDKENGLEQGDLHHGPDKNTFENTPGTNLHRICAVCHHRWHGRNDRFYDERPDSGEIPFLPPVPYFKHDPFTLASDEDFETVEVWNRQRQEKRGDYPILPPDESLLITP